MARGVAHGGVVEHEQPVVARLQRLEAHAHQHARALRIGHVGLGDPVAARLRGVDLLIHERSWFHEPDSVVGVLALAIDERRAVRDGELERPELRRVAAREVDLAQRAVGERVPGLGPRRDGRTETLLVAGRPVRRRSRCARGLAKLRHRRRRGHRQRQHRSERREPPRLQRVRAHVPSLGRGTPDARLPDGPIRTRARRRDTLPRTTSPSTSRHPGTRAVRTFAFTWSGQRGGAVVLAAASPGLRASSKSMVTTGMDDRREHPARTCGRPLSPGGSRRVRAGRRRSCRSSGAWATVLELCAVATSRAPTSYRCTEQSSWARSRCSLLPTAQRTGALPVGPAVLHHRRPTAAVAEEEARALTPRPWLLRPVGPGG